MKLTQERIEIAKENINQYYELMSKEMLQIINENIKENKENDIFYAISNAFYLGYFNGYKASQCDRKNKRKQSF